MPNFESTRCTHAVHVYRTCTRVPGSRTRVHPPIWGVYSCTNANPCGTRRAGGFVNFIKLRHVYHLETTLTKGHNTMNLMNLIKKIEAKGFKVELNKAGKLVIMNGDLAPAQVEWVKANRTALIREVILRDLAAINETTTASLAQGIVQDWGALGTSVARLPYCQSAAAELGAVLEEIAIAGDKTAAQVAAVSQQHASLYKDGKPHLRMTCAGIG